MAKPEMPLVTLLSAEEIAQAICNYTVAKMFEVDPNACDINYRVTYRQMKVGDATQLFASIAVTSVEPKAEAKATGQ